MKVGTVVNLDTVWLHVPWACLALARWWTDSWCRGELRETPMARDFDLQIKSWRRDQNARATIHIARARNCRHLDSRTIPQVPIDDTIENDPRRNRNQSIEIRKPPIWYVVMQYRYSGRRKRGGSAAAHDSKLCAPPPSPPDGPCTCIPRTS